MGDHEDSLSYLDNLLDTCNLKNLNLVRGNTQQFTPWLNLITRHNVLLLDSFRSWSPLRPLQILNRLFVIIYINQKSILLLQLLVTVSNNLSATTWKLAPTGGLNFCRAAIPSNMVVTLSGYLSVTSIRLSSCCEIFDWFVIRGRPEGSARDPQGAGFHFDFRKLPKQSHWRKQSSIHL